MHPIHQRAIDLWIHCKRKDPVANPASGIIFAITDHPLPTDLPLPSNTVELCAALSHIHGLPLPTADERMEIQMYGAAALMQAERGGLSIMRVSSALIWANRLGYILGFAAFGLTGFSWWVLGLLVGTFWAHGATRMCAQKRSEGEGPAWEMPACIAVHLACLIGLYAVSLVRIVARVST